MLRERQLADLRGRLVHARRWQLLNRVQQWTIVHLADLEGDSILVGLDQNAARAKDQLIRRASVEADSGGGGLHEDKSEALRGTDDLGKGKKGGEKGVEARQGGTTLH